MFYKEQLFDAVSLMVARAAVKTGRPIYTVNGKTTKPVSEDDVLAELAMAKTTSMKEGGIQDISGETVIQPSKSVNNRGTNRRREENINLTMEAHTHL